MKWIGKRITFDDDKQKTTIVIYPEDVSWVKAVMGAWVGMWFAIGAIMIWAALSLPLSQQELVIVVIFLSFWAYFAYKVTRSFFWILWGKELIKIDEVSVSYKKSIKKYGKSTPYYLENISKITVNQPKEKSVQAAWEKSPWIAGGERIEFDYLGKVVKLGKKLNEKDTQLLFALITKRIDQRLRKK